jgi:hypothetical protein
MTKWTAPDIASIRGDNSRPLQKIFGSLTEYLKDASGQHTEVSQTYVRNGETTTLTIGTVVYLDAQQGNRATVKRAFNTSDATSAKTLGVVAENIAPNADGLVTTLGYLEKVNTSAFTAGQTLYLGATAGTFTATKPVAPNHMVYVGVVVRANAGNGIIYVRCQNGYELDEIHDVLITSPATGNILMRNSSNLWVNTPQTSITSVGTLTAGTVPATLLSGTVASARLSGSYTGITGLGTVTVGDISSSLLSGTIASARLSGGYTGITALGALTELLVGKNCTTATVAAANDTGSFSVRGNASFPAVMSFHRTGAYAVNFGLSTSNVMELGGWSAGTIKFSVNMVNGNVTAVGALNAYSISGNSNVAGTGNASYHPSGVYSTGPNWLYGTVLTNGSDIGSSSQYVGSVYANNWFRSSGTSGWYSQTYGGGIYMEDTTWVRVYNSKRFFSPGGYSGNIQYGSYGSMTLYGTNNGYAGISTPDVTSAVMWQNGVFGAIFGHYKNDNAWNFYVGNGTFTPSDARYKRDIEPLQHGMNFIREIVPVTYDPLTEDPNDDPETTFGRTHYGFTTQNILQALTNAGETRDVALVDIGGPDSASAMNSDRQYLNHSGLIAPMVKAIQELDARLQQLETV